MLKAKHHWLVYPFFSWYTKYLIHRHFHHIVLNGSFDDRGLPVLLISRHQSWWDGFWAMRLNQKVFKRKFTFMMQEEQLRKYWYFNYAGGFSVKNNSRSVIETLNYTAELLRNPKHLVLMFPEGKIRSLYAGDILFQRGVEHILHRVHQEIHIVFAVFLIEYASFSRPVLYGYYTEYKEKGLIVNILQQSYNRFYHDCLAQHQCMEF